VWVFSAFIDEKVADTDIATLPVTFSSTPSLTHDTSSKSVDEDEDDVLQIDELMAPSSPPVSNTDLKGLFRSRMGDSIWMTLDPYVMIYLFIQMIFCSRNRSVSPNIVYMIQRTLAP
jgi:hypothetical protein